MKIGQSRFWDGFIRATVYFLLIPVAQYLFSAPTIVIDGCGYMGFPLIFFRNCYWSGAHFSSGVLLVDMTVWLLCAVVLGMKWRRLTN